MASTELKSTPCDISAQAKSGGGDVLRVLLRRAQGPLAAAGRAAGVDRQLHAPTWCFGIFSDVFHYHQDRLNRCFCIFLPPSREWRHHGVGRWVGAASLSSNAKTPGARDCEDSETPVKKREFRFLPTKKLLNYNV